VLVYGNLADINAARPVAGRRDDRRRPAASRPELPGDRALAESRRQATTDELTGLPNHRYVYERLSREVAAAEAVRAPLTLLVADLDGFKELNDTLGHHAGDLLLQQVGPRVLDAEDADGASAPGGGGDASGQGGADGLGGLRRRGRPPQP
jgi:predicted signal transduction protein with EAL and GGDEF domain